MKKMKISYVLCICFTSSKWCANRIEDYNGFLWPSKGRVTYPNFRSNTEGTHGLMGLLNGCGSSRRPVNGNEQWLLVAVPTDTLIHLQGGVKFLEGEVIMSSQSRYEVIAELERLNPATKGMPIIGANRVSLERGSFVAVGDYGIAVAQDKGTAVAGEQGSAIAGHGGIAMSGYGGTSTVGDFGKASSLERGTVIAGANGVATVKASGSKAKAGINGKLIFTHNYMGKVFNFLVDGITVKPDTFYRCWEGKLLLAE